MEAVALQSVTIRPLKREDLAAVVAIDAASEGMTRRAYFERRLVAALNEPKLHAQFAATDEKGLAGYILARVLTGEFGRVATALRLEVIGVRPDARGQRVGASLFDALSDHGSRHGISEVRTTAAWNDHRMLRWIDAMGFTLAPDHVVDCAVDGGEYKPQRDDPANMRTSGTPLQRSIMAVEAATISNVSHATAPMSARMEPGDLADIVRIDRSITGRDRRELYAAQAGRG